MIICYLPSEYVQYVVCHMIYSCHILRRQYREDSLESHYIERTGMSLYEVEPDSYIGRLPFIQEKYSTYGRSPWGVSCTYDELYVFMSTIYFMSSDFTEKDVNVKDVPIQEIAKNFVDRMTLSQSQRDIDPFKSTDGSVNTIKFNDGSQDNAYVLSRFCEDFSFEYHSRFSAIVITVPSLEYAYQASKATTSQDERYVLQAASSLEAKRRGNEIIQRPDWIESSLAIMFSLALQHALSNHKVSSYLLSTGEAKLVNSGVLHKDSYWSDYQGGQDMLGKIWMIVRNLLNGYIVKGL